MNHKTPNDFLKKFCTKVRVLENGCWSWIGGLDLGGYGSFKVQGKTYRAHRWSYHNFVGPIPQGLEIDHLCKVRNCVNPQHLEAVTHRENVMRSNAPKLAGERMKIFMLTKTHCPQGHEYSDINTYKDCHGWRSCKICHRNTCREYMRKKRMKHKNKV